VEKSLLVMAKLAGRLILEKQDGGKARARLTKA
jgi:hypothetical protein